MCLAEGRPDAVHLSADRHRLAALPVQSERKLLGGQALGVHREHGKGLERAQRALGACGLELGARRWSE